MEIILFGKYHGKHGPSRVTHGLSRALGSLGYSPTVLTYGDQNEPPHSRVTIECLGSMPDSVFEWKQIYKSAQKYVSKANPEIFHALERYPFESDIRTVQWTSDMFVMWRRTGQRPPIVSFAGECIMNWYSRKGAKSSTVTIAQSPETVSQMHSLWRLSPDHVIPLGIEKEFRTAPSKINDPIKVLLVGRIEHRKGHRRLLRHLDPKTNEYELTIVGSISDEDYAQQALEGWREHHVGYLSDKKLEREYEDADVVVVPSYLETFSMVGLEALAKGCALVITDDCGLAQFSWATPENGVFVADGGQHAAELLRDVAGANSLPAYQSAAYQLTEKLTWSRIIQDYIDKYEDIEKYKGI